MGTGSDRLRGIRHWLLLGIGMAAVSTASSAAEDDFFGAVPIVLTPTRLAQTPLESPSSVTIIDRDLILASGVRTVADILALVPGFQVGYARANRPVVTYHGLGDQFARRMQVLIDGRSVYVPLYGGVPWENLPLTVEDIERIEVVRGPNAASFGPNSFTAIINIITRNAYEESGVMVRGNRGENGINDGMLRLSGKAGDGAYRFTLDRQADDGFDDQFDSGESDQFTFRYDRSLGANDDIMFQVGLNRGENQIDDGLLSRSTDAEYRFYLFNWEHAFNARETFNLRVHGTYYETEDRQFILDPAPGFDSVLVDNSGDSNRTEIEAQWNLEFGDRLRTVFGGSLREDRIRAPGLLNSDDWIDNQVRRVFAHAEYRFNPQFIVNIGTMYEKNDLTGTDDSPRIAAIYKIDDTQSLRVSRSQATRTPVIFEENSELKFIAQMSPELAAQLPAFVALLQDPNQFNAPDLAERIINDGSLDTGTIIIRDWLGIGGLDPERITSTEIGYRKESLDRRLSLDVKIFEDRMDDLLLGTNRTDISAEIDEYIELANDPNNAVSPNGVADSHFNAVEVRIQGLETGLDWRPVNELRLFAGFSYLETESNNFDHENSVPRRIISLLGQYRFTPSHSLSAFVQHQDEFEWVDANKTLSYTRLDLHFLETFRWRQNFGSMSLVLQDVLGSQESYFEDRLQSPRAFVRFSLLFP